MRLHLLPIIILYIATLLIVWYICNDIRHYTGGSLKATSKRLSRHLKYGRGKNGAGSKGTLIYLIFAVLTIGLLSVAVALPHRNAEQNLQPKMWMLFTFLTIFFAQTVYVICSIIGRLPQLWRKERWTSGLWVGVPLGVLTFVIMWWGALVDRRNIEVIRVDIVSGNLPESFNGYKIAQISDLHVGTWGNDTTFISELVDSVNSLNPDLIVFTGDLVNRMTSEAEPFLTVLGRLHAPDGVLSVLGNHDYGDYITWNDPADRDENNALMRQWQSRMGWKLMNNTRRFISNAEGDSIVIIGVENWGEPPFPTYGRLTEAYPMNRDSIYHLNDNRFKVLLSHNPEHWNREVSKITNVDLTLSGHTHAMQIEFKFGNNKWSPAKYRYGQWGGLYDRVNHNGENTELYVNIGAGEVGLPMRIGAIPEITLLTLRSPQSKPTTNE